MWKNNIVHLKQNRIDVIKVIMHYLFNNFEQIHIRSYGTSILLKFAIQAIKIMPFLYVLLIKSSKKPFRLDTKNQLSTNFQRFCGGKIFINK